MKLGECIQVDPLFRFMGPIGSKVIEVKGQICFFFRSKVIEVKGQIYGFFLLPQVLGPIFTKLGGKVEGGPGY